MAQHYDIAWLKSRADAGDAIKYLFFWGHTNKSGGTVDKSCFSQWYQAPFIGEGIEYKTAEHWMMAKKALLFNDMQHFEKIVHCGTPAEAKKLGRQVAGFDETLWDENRFEFVKLGNIHKFSSHPAMADYLLQTGEKVIVEASPMDTIWGIGLGQDNPRAQDVYKWRGLNLLGFALMEARDVLRSRNTL